MSHPAIEQLSSEFRKNHRLRIGIWLIIGIVMFYGGQKLNIYFQQIKKAHFSAVEQLNQLNEIAQQSEWTERAAQAKALVDQLTARLWKADTKGLAQATFQQWLNTKVSTFQFQVRLLQVESAFDVKDIPNVWRVDAKLYATFTPRNLNLFLSAIASNPQLIVTESLEIRAGNNPNFTIIVGAYFQAMKK